MNKKLIFWKKWGFMALISVFIVSVIVLVIITSLSINLVKKNQVTTSSISALNAYYLANACAEEGLLRIKGNLTFSNETLVIDSNNQCVVDIVFDWVNFTLTATWSSYGLEKIIQIVFFIDTEVGLKDEFDQSHTRHNIFIFSWNNV